MVKFRFPKFFLFLAFVLAYSLQLTMLSSLYAQDKIIAIVNNDALTQKDLNDFINFMRMQLARDYKGRELENKIQSIKLDLLDRLIEDRLILQEAKREIEEARKNKDNYTLLRLEVEPSRVKGRLNEIKSHYSQDADFQKELIKQGLVQADIEKKIREQMLMYNIIEYRIKDKIVIRPDEVTKFYNENIKEFLSPEVRELEVIGLENDDLAKTFAYHLKTGQKLEDLATRYPITVDKLSVEQNGQLKKEIEDVVFKLGMGEISAPLKIEDKYYVFRLNNTVPSRQLGLSEAQGGIHNYLFEKKMQEEMTQWLDELKAKSHIKIFQN